MTAPPGVPECLSRGQVARALNVKEETVKGWLNRGTLPSLRFAEGASWRYVRLSDLTAFTERYALTVNWAALL